MTSESSEIVDFYPRSFTIDMNGKRWPWEAVVLLPFIDSKRLLDASAKIDDTLVTEAEKDRNKIGNAVVFEYNEDTSFDLEGAGDGKLFSLLPGCKTKTTNFDDSCLAYKEEKKPTMTPKLTDGVKYPLPAYPTLRDGCVVGIWRKLLRINVHGSKSRYKTACLEIQNPVPESIPLAELSKSLIGTIVYIQYPHHIPSFVTAVSNSQGCFRGKDSEMQQWSEEDLTSRNRRLSKIVNNYVFGEKLVGTGGLTLVDGEEVMDTLS
jgi:5'-3' exonuclease